MVSTASYIDQFGRSCRRETPPPSAPVIALQPDPPGAEATHAGCGKASPASPTVLRSHEVGSLLGRLKWEFSQPQPQRHAPMTTTVSAGTSSCTGHRRSDSHYPGASQNRVAARPAATEAGCSGGEAGPGRPNHPRHALHPSTSCAQNMSNNVNNNPAISTEVLPARWTSCSDQPIRSSPQSLLLFDEAAADAIDTIWPPRAYNCTFCRREFRSAQALGGHMNVHRRDRARLRQSSPLSGINSCISSSTSSTSSSSYSVDNPQRLVSEQLQRSGSAPGLIFPNSMACSEFRLSSPIASSSSSGGGGGDTHSISCIINQVQSTTSTLAVDHEHHQKGIFPAAQARITTRGAAESLHGRVFSSNPAAASTSQGRLGGSASSGPAAIRSNPYPISALQSKPTTSSTCNPNPGCGAPLPKPPAPAPVSSNPDSLKRQATANGPLDSTGLPFCTPLKRTYNKLEAASAGARCGILSFRQLQKIEPPSCHDDHIDDVQQPHISKLPTAEVPKLIHVDGMDRHSFIDIDNNGGCSSSTLSIGMLSSCGRSWRRRRRSDLQEMDQYDTRTDGPSGIPAANLDLELRIGHHQYH